MDSLSIEGQAFIAFLRKFVLTYKFKQSKEMSNGELLSQVLSYIDSETFDAEEESLKVIVEELKDYIQS